MSPTPPSFLPALQHMNADHVGSLQSITQHHLGLSRHPPHARMTALDEGGFEVEYALGREGFWGKSPEKRGVRIPWGEGAQVREPMEVRKRLVKLAEESQSGRNKQYPVLYSPPPQLPLALLLFSFLLILASPPSTSFASSLLSRLPFAAAPHHSTLQSLHARLVPASLSSTMSAPGGRALPTLHFLLQAVVVAHAFEAVGMFAFVLVGRKGGLGKALAWAATTFPVGFPTFFEFRKLNYSSVVKDGRAKAKGKGKGDKGGKAH